MKKLLTFLTLLTLSIGVTWAADVTDVLTRTTTGVTGNSYSDWSGKTATSNAVYAGNSAGGNTSIQLRDNTNSGIVTTASGGRIKSITVSWNSNTTNGRTLDIYGKNSAYSATSDLYGENKGTLLGSIVKGSSTSLTVSGDYQYIGLCSAKGAMYLTSITIIWETGGSTVETVATPTFSPAEGTFIEAQNVTISCATSGATIHYTTDGTNPTTSSATFSSAIAVSETTTIKAIAVKSGMNNSSVATATYTINAPLTSLADVNGLDDNDVFTYGAQTVVLGTYGNGNKNMYIVMPDNSVGTLVYDASNSWSDDYTFGKVINSGWGGTKTTYYTKPEVKNPTNFSLSGTTAEVTPIEITSSDLTKENFGRYAVLKGVTVTSGGAINGITTYDQFGVNFNSSAGSYDVYGVIGWHNNAGQFMPLEYVPASAPAYYLVGTFNNWNQSAEYIFTKSGDSYVLNGVDLPDNAEFQINKVVNGVTTWIGGYADGEVYGIHGGHHENIGLGGSKNFKIEAGAITNFSFTMNNDNPDKLTVSRDAQFFVKGDFNGWNREAMTATATGWTIEHVISSANQFGFVDEWGYWYGGRDWWINEEHLDTELEIKPDGNFYMNIDGTDDYTLTVNSAKTTLTVSKIEVPTGDDYVLVTDVDDLDTSSSFIIVSKENDMAMAEQRTSNREGKAVTLKENGSKAVPDEDIIELFSLEEGSGGWYFKATNISPGYLYASSSSSNQLKTSDQIDSNGNSLATISINGSTGVASIKFQGTNTRNTLQFNLNNNNPPIFNCYSSASQQPVYLYKKVEAIERATPPVITPASQNVKGGLLEGVMITAAEGATIHYTLDGTEPTVDSPEFDGQAFNITGTGGERKMVRAIAVEADKAPSYPASVTYTFQAPATPTISPDAGTYNEAVTVTITSTDGGTIYYLVDPEEAPTNATGVITAGQVYTEGETTITLSENGTHKVYAAVDLNGITSWAQATYTIILPTPTQVTLAELCQNGVITEGENWYVISDKLIAVYADATKGILWCKDMGNASIFSTSIKDGQVDFLKDDPQAQNGRDWDQSNWIALHFSTPTATNNIDQLVNGAVNRYIKPGTVKGKLIDEVNYALRMDLDQLELVTQADDPDINPNYIPNVYCPANFMPTNLNIWGNDEDGGYTTGSDQNYFFMNPKIQEICEVTYAQWDARNLCFTVPSQSGFDGAFYIGTGYNVIESTNFTSSLQDEHIYRFKAIVQRSDKDNYGPKNVTTPATGITLYPIDLDPSENGGSDITTAINTVETGNGEVKSVKYVNVAGIVSDKPFQGVNIVVTEYTDGSRTTTKMLRK